MNGGSVATSPTPYATNGYNGNGYNGYNENSSVVSANGNGSTCIENNGYNGNESSSAQFVRRRLLPAIPRGETRILIFFSVFLRGQS